MRGTTGTERWALDRRRAFDAQIAALVRQAVEAGEVGAGVEPAPAARLRSGMVGSAAEWYRRDHPGSVSLPTRSRQPPSPDPPPTLTPAR